jgi:hypothetical protein
MQDNKDKIKDIAGKGLSSFEADPPAGLWPSIAAEIRRRKRVVFFLYLSVSATILLLAGVSALLTLNDVPKNSLQPNQVARQNQTVPAAENPASKDSTPFAKTEISPKSSSQVKALATESFKSAAKSRQFSAETSIARKQVDLKMAKDKFYEKVSEVAIAENIEINDSIHQAITPTNPPETLAETPVESDITGPADVITVETPPIPKAIYKGSWDLALGFGANSSVSISDNNAALAKGNSNYLQDDFSAEVAEETAYFEDVESTTHNAPLVFGLSISRNISKRWNLETGLVYSRLGTVIRASEINAAYNEYKSVLNYLGVPVGVRFEILKYNSLGIYAMQSVVFEKGVSSSRTTNIFKENALVSTETVSFQVRGIQVSSITGMGAEVDVVKQLGFYGQAGAQVFFLNASQPYNIRSAQLVWPSFQLGLRFHL